MFAHVNFVFSERSSFTVVFFLLLEVSVASSAVFLPARGLLDRQMSQIFNKNYFFQAPNSHLFTVTPLANWQLLTVELCLLFSALWC